MALVSGDRSAQDRRWRHQPGSQRVGSGLENGAARSQRAHGGASQSAREDPASWGREEKGEGDGPDLTSRPGGGALSQGGSDEPDQMDDAFVDPVGQGTRGAGTSHQEDGAGRLAARARLFAQGQQKNDGRHFSCRPRSAVWAYHGSVQAVRAEASASNLGGL